MEKDYNAEWLFCNNEAGLLISFWWIVFVGLTEDSVEHIMWRQWWWCEVFCQIGSWFYVRTSHLVSLKIPSSFLFSFWLPANLAVHICIQTNHSYHIH